MSQYIHEIVLQEFIIENIKALKFNIKYRNTMHELIEARFNKNGSFWDLEGKLDNGLWIPVEVEWISENFISHNHGSSKSFSDFLKKKGILIVVRKNREIEKIHQYSILDVLSQGQFKSMFAKWLKNKAEEYSISTLNDFFVGNYKRKVSRILVIPVSNNARSNYFSMEPLYRKTEDGPLMIGFKEDGFNNNEFVRDIQEGDICLFIDSDGTRMPRKSFLEKVKKRDVMIRKMIAFQIKGKIFKINDKTKKDEKIYWPDEMKKKEVIYPYRCHLANHAFVTIENVAMPYIENFTEAKWEALRSCLQYGKYFEMESNDFIAIISKAQN